MSVYTAVQTVRGNQETLLAPAQRPMSVDRKIVPGMAEDQEPSSINTSLAVTWLKERQRKEGSFGAQRTKLIGLIGGCLLSGVWLPLHARKKAQKRKSAHQSLVFFFFFFSFFLVCFFFGVKAGTLRFEGSRYGSQRPLAS